ncbi:hypothetical protein AMTRI_Chr05g73550 [Amborella trichopoda]
MGGAGKTTLAKEVNNQLQSNTNFDIVIWVTVSSNPDLSGLQKRIGERLGLLDLSNCSYETTREKLLSKLRRTKMTWGNLCHSKMSEFLNQQLRMGARFS